ncbi:amidohydrolase [Sphingopyxis macrogoltabida]|uniref:Amidohydrolase n=1 Tax=Sphingopyxis macrogoltabida TaxID=33050 RepID=A0AAC9FG12_SPHMC|nr:amidohydrolase [Sphingopyxis macrogoltabida]ALJ14727.1 amidohydrolase [Sphingopyxis macrogoltabida]AMU90983.1 amidohydrolase [Sphingopyxis macrogoltabida]
MTALALGVAPALADARSANDADAVYYNGKIATLDKASTTVSGVAIRDGRFIAVGDDKLARSFVGKDTEVVNLRGRTVIPGLNDSHTHVEVYGQQASAVPLAKTKTVAEALAVLKSFVATRPPGEWVIGSSWHPLSQLAEHRYLTRAELDAVAPNNPIYLPTVGHSAMVNSAALRLAGIDRRTVDPAGGKIERDANGELNGVLQEKAVEHVASLIPPYTIEQIEDQFLRSFEWANSYGITSVLEGALRRDQIRALQRLMDDRRLPVRVGVLWAPNAAAPFEDWQTLMEGNGFSSGFGNEWLKIAGIKIVADGGMTLRTAFTTDAYPGDPHYHGIAALTHDRLLRLVEIANTNDWRVATHCVGDQACDWVLDAYEAANRQRPIADRRFALIHGSLIRADQLRRMKALGARLEAQNLFMWDKAATVEKFLGTEAANRAIPDRLAINILGIDNVSLGSDFPISTLNPFVNMYIAVTRKDSTGTVYGADQAVTREEALRMYTVSGAFATRDEDAKGTIEIGKLADMAVLSDDYFSVDAEAIKDIRVERTVVGGKTVFLRPDAKADGDMK